MVGADLELVLNYVIGFVSVFTVMVFLLLFLKHRHCMHHKPPAKGWVPVVSIVIPAYNESRYIKTSLESVLGLNYPKNKTEIIIVDDGSTDNTMKIAKGYEKRGVKVFTKTNEGKAAALNFGIKKARGELIVTMDADSYLSPNCLNEMLPLFGEDVAAVTAAVKIKASDSWIKEFQRVEYLLILFSRKLLSYIDCVPVTPGPFSIFRKSALEAVGGFDERNLVEDQEIALRLQSHHYRIASSMSAEVYTEPPETIGNFLKQRIRWQRGGLRNYWDYKFLIKPEYGDFGVFFVPLNYISIIGLVLIFILMINSIISQPYYSRYIWLDILGLSIGFFTFTGAVVIASSFLFLYLSIRAFREEKIKFRYVLAFMVFYWYFMVICNLLTFWKEIRKEPAKW
jgi:cellulose synthase/poly-beta-1,6-N-acetylglucosamine synthase-like glycosyltransferase